jgi:hypothetical protein
VPPQGTLHHLKPICATVTPLTCLICTAAQAQDAGVWSGAYGGISVSDASGFQSYHPLAEYDLGGEMAGVIIGYNHAAGPWVFGAELA